MTHPLPETCKGPILNYIKLQEELKMLTPFPPPLHFFPCSLIGQVIDGIVFYIPNVVGVASLGFLHLGVREGK